MMAFGSLKCDDVFGNAHKFTFTFVFSLNSHIVAIVFALHATKYRIVQTKTLHIYTYTNLDTYIHTYADMREKIGSCCIIHMCMRQHQCCSPRPRGRTLAAAAASSHQLCHPSHIAHRNGK